MADRALTDQQERGAAARYENGESSYAIADDFGVSRPTICAAIRRQGGTLRRACKHRTYALNETAFDVVTDEAAYWVGFLMADGCVMDKVNNRGSSAECIVSVLQVSLQARDEPHLLKLRSFVGSSAPLRRFISLSPAGKKCPAVTLSFSSNHMGKILAAHGIVPRKSLTASTPTLASNRHFWRGVIDGDGTLVFEARPEIPLVNVLLIGSHALTRQFAEFVAGVVGDVPKSPRPRLRCGMLKYGSLDGVRITKILYDHCTVALDRKHAIAKQIMASEPVFHRVKSWEADEMRERRIRAGMTLKALADATGIRANCLAQIENGTFSGNLSFAKIFAALSAAEARRL